MIDQIHVLAGTAQAVAEYGVLQSLSLAFKNLRTRVELIIGQGNFKYLIFAILLLLVILTARAYRKR